MSKETIILLIVLIIAMNIIRPLLNTANSKYTLNDNLIDQIAANVPNYTKYEDIPQNLKNAVIATEDRRFYKHSGFDMISIGRAIYVNLKAGRVKQGGSTITQQLAKNLFLSNERSFKRKFKEVFFTIELERRYSKKQILEMYLNVIYYGANTYGIGNASKKFFHKDAKDLSLAECAMLAGVPQSPNNYCPLNHLDRAKKRQQVVLKSMERSGYIKGNTVEEAQSQLLLIGE
ncbi:transglycosylase domain-containing protein [Anaeromicropila herbilytica]|uniref:Penicillin-binding protein 1A n=1 Tax=Anaeromicropila herbilytica TaxID=2785025 RepID=A0A7R7IBZ6_9FIRM|nr:biosynthetic peptidoglycan transglycosylase [Anaeromicropila herbilytica]BCN29359.1 hypothetical protein bsdtb5_06540 [Anaeromicropila herbilytica]